MHANLHTVTALVQLKEGIATPLEFIFKPKMPFYPMEISGVNAGHTTITIYLFGEQCFDDASQILQFDHAVQDSALAEKYGFDKAKCISKLKYSGSTSNLSADSFFTEKPFDPKYDPKYIAPKDPASETLGAIYWIVLFLAILIVFFASWAIVPGLAIGIAIAYFAEKNKAKSTVIRVAGIIALLLAILIPIALVIAAMGLSSDATWISGLYALFPIGSFLFGYFATKKKKWKTAIAIISGLIIIIIIGAIVLSFGFY
jgi:hypothetical protein